METQLQLKLFAIRMECMEKNFNVFLDEFVSMKDLLKQQSVNMQDFIKQFGSYAEFCASRGPEVPTSSPQEEKVDKVQKTMSKSTSMSPLKQKANDTTSQTELGLKRFRDLIPTTTTSSSTVIAKTVTSTSTSTSTLQPMARANMIFGQPLQIELGPKKKFLRDSTSTASTSGVTGTSVTATLKDGNREGGVTSEDKGDMEEDECVIVQESVEGGFTFNEERPDNDSTCIVDETLADLEEKRNELSENETDQNDGGGEAYGRRRHRYPTRQVNLNEDTLFDTNLKRPTKPRKKKRVLRNELRGWTTKALEQVLPNFKGRDWSILRKYHTWIDLGILDHLPSGKSRTERNYKLRILMNKMKRQDVAPRLSKIVRDKFGKSAEDDFLQNVVRKMRGESDDE